MKTLLATTAIVLTAGLALSGAPQAQAQDRASEAAPFAQTVMPGDLMTRELMGRDVYARPDDVEPGEVILPADWDGRGLPLFHADDLEDIASSSTPRKARSIAAAISQPVRPENAVAMRPASQSMTRPTSGRPVRGSLPVQLGMEVSR